jgi:hypothetical protein
MGKALSVIQSQPKGCCYQKKQNHKQKGQDLCAIGWVAGKFEKNVREEDSKNMTG